MIPMVVQANPKVQEFLTLLKEPEVLDVLKGIVVQVLTDPDYLVLKRISNIEHHLGADDDYCLWEDSFHEDKRVMHPMPEQISLLTSLINDTSIPILHETVFSGNETEVRARLLKDKLPEVQMRNGSRFMDSKEVRSFLLHEVTETHRTTEKAARKVSNDVMKKAIEMFPETVKLTKNKKGLNIIILMEKR